MEISIPFKVEYKTEQPVPIPEIVDSLLSIQQILEEAAANLETFVPGLKVENVVIRVQEISHGSLKEILLIGLFAYFQEDLEREVPALIEEFTGVVMPENTHTLLTILALVALVYGADFVKNLVAGTLRDTPTKVWKRNLIKELAATTGKDEAEVTRLLDERYGPKTKIKQLGDAAVKFFKPSKQQNNAPIQIGNQRIDPPLIADVPADYLYEDASEVERSAPHYGVRLEIHQKDRDRENSGWAAVPVGLHPKRLTMKLVDGVAAEDLWESEDLVADIILISKRRGLEFVPAEIHVTRLIT